MGSPVPLLVIHAIGLRRFLRPRYVIPTTQTDAEQCDCCQKPIPPNTVHVNSADIPRYSPVGRHYCLHCCELD